MTVDSYQSYVTPDCDGCLVAEQRYETAGTPTVCGDCGRVYAADDWRWPVAAPAEPATVEQRPPPVDGLERLLVDLEALSAWARERSMPWVPAATVSPLARLQGQAACGAAASDATWSQVARLSSLVRDPRSKVGREARAGFVAALLRYCESTSRAASEPADPARGTAIADRVARLRALPDGDELAPVVGLLRERARRGLSWDAACVLVAELAPSTLRASWSARSTSVGPGRPRVDPTRPPPEAARRAWGDARLRATIDAWEVLSA